MAPRSDTVVRSLSFIAVLGLAIAGATGLVSLMPSDKQLKFREEVQLKSGEIIEVERKLRMRAFGEIGGPGGADAAWNSMAIIDSGVQKHIPEWRSEAGLVPMLLDRDPLTGEWFVVATFYSCDAWYRLGRPKLPYAEFRLRDGRWQQQLGLTTALIGRESNVLVHINNSKELSQHTLATKEERNSDARIAREYRSIIGKWSTAC